jgi:aldose 1-epimerase
MSSTNSILEVTPALKRITLTNANLMQVTLCDFGARILSIKVPNKSKELVETTLNYYTDKEILNDESYMGATCGRVSNRIAGAKYEHKGHTYSLSNNEGANTLHGGEKGFSDQRWSMSDVQLSGENQTLTFTLISPNGDQGFPGKLTALVTYTLNNQNVLSIEYAATCEAMCPINMCNHTYFHLGENSIHGLKLQVNATSYTPIDKANIPTGEVAPAEQAFDFTQAKTLSEKLAMRDFDECFIVNDSHNARLTSSKTAIQLDIHSDQVALQVYTGNYLPIKHSAIALEAQGLINAVNQANFQEEWVGPGHDYKKTIRYVFTSF